MPRLPAAQRRAQLLDTAAELFATRGYAKATTSELARAAGVTEPIIYRHFGSKRELFVALIQRTSEETIAFWEQQLASTDTPAERLATLVDGNPMVHERFQDAYRVILQAITEVDDEGIQRALQEHMAAVHAFLAREIEAAQDAHQVTKKYSPEIIGWLLIDLGLGFGVLSAWGVEGHGRDVRGRHVSDAIKRMLVGKEAPVARGSSKKPA
ncbi:MAG: TetR/AcrR family transcriptional regulator [Planctomycetota bacterium]